MYGKHCILLDEVKGKVALVTGAASGIDRAVAELLHARGAKVVAEDIDTAVKELERDGLISLTPMSQPTAQPRRR
jgi:NAD(P)-dependent dehydrogenase (short-subunit alcohol dehydrogenase family)